MHRFLHSRAALHRVLLSALDARALSRGRRHWSDGQLVSFPIATYDRIDILVERTIPSILGQTHSEVEIVVVLDGTPSDMAQKIDQLQDERIRVVPLKRRTRYPRTPEERWMVAGWRPRNRGVRKSRGQWVYWISDDDVLLPHAVADLLAHARAEEAESVSGGYQAGLKNPTPHYPGEGIEHFGVPISGPPAWICRSYVAKMRWNRLSWVKKHNRPSDYDLFERMVRRKVRFSSLQSIVAVQPEVEGTEHSGRKGAIQAWSQASTKEFK